MPNRAGVLKKGTELAAKIIKRGLRSKVVSAYNDAQDNAQDYDEYQSLVQAGKQEEADWFAHDKGIAAVWILLVSRAVIPGSTPSEVVDAAFSEVS